MVAVTCKKLARRLARAGATIAQRKRATHEGNSTEAGLQYTIETRQLTSEYTHRPAADPDSAHLIVEASDADEAISKFVLQQNSELVSYMRPVKGRESIATVKKDDSVYLVRVYAA
jgi:hypothetical protein